MNPDPPSLDQLRDIIVPPDISWWPLAPGWWVLILGGVILVTVLAWRGFTRWQRNAYRREALDQLNDATGAAEIATLLKRTALTAFERKEVAGLTGEAWCDWLEQTGPDPMTPENRQTLQAGAFVSETEASPGLRTFAIAWIKGHQNTQPRATESC
ncbi:MAG: DUF4381 domain-containing protein [Verrucomicrobiota bacterium]